MIQKEDYYETLDLSSDATDKQIKRHYHILASKWHPNKNPIGRRRSEKVFTELSEAYEVLSNKRLRRLYDEDGYEKVLNSSISRFDFSSFNLPEAEAVFEKFNRGRDPFSILEENDPFFEDDFFDLDREEFFQKSHSPSRFFETSTNTKKVIKKSPRSSGTEKSVKTVIVDKDGRRVKKTVTTVTNPDGSQEVIEEETEEPSTKYLRDS
jgi:DnaJ homolog subfamily B member 6